MQKLWTFLFLVTATNCIEIPELPETTSSIEPPNTTTLYPINEQNSTQKNVTSTENTQKDATSTESKQIKTEATAWKIDAAYSLPKEVEKNETSKEAGKSVNVSEEFRPSPHLGTFYEVEGVQIPPTQSTFPDLDFNPVLNKPSGIFQPSKRERPDFPYKLESPVFPRAVSAWKPSAIEAKPTVASPFKVPAGGLYKVPEPLKQRPASEDFDLDLHGHKDSPVVHKRASPWKGLLNLVTAFLPVGLIISALTPSLLTIQDTGNQYPSQGYIRRTESLPQLPVISEQCRRRLLCELHNEKNYGSSHRKPKKCYKIPCDDPVGLSTNLNWLLSHHQQPPSPDLVEPFT